MTTDLTKKIEDLRATLRTYRFETAAHTRKAVRAIRVARKERARLLTSLHSSHL